MWAGWVDENTRSPMELSDNVVVGETAFFSELAPSFVDGDDSQNHDSASQERDSSPVIDSSSASLVPDKYQESLPEHIAHLEGEWNEDDIYYSDEDDLLDDLCENCCPQTASPESPDVVVEEEVYSPSHTGLVTIKEESDTGEENNNGSSTCEDTVNNNNNNNNNKTDVTETTGDICSCSTVVEDVVDVDSRCSPTSVQVSCEKAAAVDVSSSSRIDEEKQGVRSTEATSAEKPVSPRTLLAARPQFFKLPRFLVNTIRQPINPLYHQTVLDRAWGGSNGQAPHKIMGPEQRRFLFAQTAKLYYDHHPDQSEVKWEGPVKRYSRDVLLRFSHSPASYVRPSGLPSLPCVQ
ncbi:uncharacterized protein [Branchiostoma lanceolatum]|uniref:uncharacterized protein n=1 Tax=Branchiostoma lanceolatum TaxID=7740 RepID=UPI003454D698